MLKFLTFEELTQKYKKNKLVKNIRQKGGLFRRFGVELRGSGRVFWRRSWEEIQGLKYIKGMGFLTLGPFPKRP